MGLDVKTHPNIELLDETLAHIEAHPETWKQGSWRCETGMCFAGWVCELTGGEWVDTPDNEWGGHLVAEPEDDATYVDTVGKVVHASTRANRLLGLSTSETNELFNASNDITGIRNIIRRIKKGVRV